MQMASGTPCLNSRWDQPKPKTGMVQGILENVSQALSSNVGSTCHNTVATGSSPVMMQAAAAASTAGPPGTSHPHPHPRPPPVGQSDPPQGGVEMAVAMAAKINAMLMAKGKLKPLQPLPSKAPPSALQPVSSEEVVVAEVDINDVPVNCRDLLTKGKTQEEIRQYSGAVVSTKGLYIGDGEKTSNIRVERPLYLHVQGRSQDEVNKAVMRIKEIISEDVMRASGGKQSAVMPPVAVYPQPRHAAPVQPLQPPLPTTPRPPNAPVTPAHRPPPPHQGSFVHTKIFVGLDQSLPSFSVNERVEGPNGTYLQHIQTETGARVFLRGKGSGYIEQASRRESFEPLYLYISHPNSAGLEAAKKLCESLLETVRAEHARMLTVYTATGSTQAYPAHGYNSSSSGSGGSSSSSYSSQSWYGYPGTGYSSAYPTYPASGGYWSTANGPPGQTVVSTPSQGMIQYPVCPRQPNTFLLQEEGLSSDEVAHDSVTSNAKSPKRRFLEEGEEDAERTEQGECDDPVTETVFSTDGGSKSDRVLMPPPPPSLLPTASLKRSREAEHPGLDLPHNSVNNTGAPVEVKKNKLASDSSGLVPYGGDSSDEEEERIRSGRKSSA